MLSHVATVRVFLNRGGAQVGRASSPKRKGYGRFHCGLLPRGRIATSTVIKVQLITMRD